MKRCLVIWPLGADATDRRPMAACRLRGLEGNVVFGAAATDAGALEVRGIGRDVAGRGEAAAVAALLLATATTTAARAVTGAEELDRVGDDLDRLAFTALLG